MARVSAPPKEITKEIKYFKGLKISVNNAQIDDQNSPDMLNMMPDDRGALDKRFGKINLFPSLDAGATYIFTYRKSTGDIHVFKHGTKFYKITDLAEGTYEEEYSGVASGKIRAFNYNDLFYFLDGTNFYQYNGTTVSVVTGKIPTIAISTPPAGGGTLFEPLNYIQPGFKQQFSADGTATAYQLALTGLDATLVTATVDGVAKVETTDFTVNRTTGIVTFLSAPPDTTPDNVVITAYKTFAGSKDEIFKCTIPYVWGGADGARIWLTGGTFKHRDYMSGIQDPTYWPVTGFDNIGNTDNPIKGYSELYGVLLILKQRGVFLRRAVDSEDGTTYVVERLNGDVGCEATDSIQILDTFPTFISKKGVYQVVSVDTSIERNVLHISDDIDKNVNILSIDGLLEMGNLENYVSIDFNGKYWLFNPSNGIVWVYDYRYIVDGIGQWFKLNNLYSASTLEIDSDLYMGESRAGLINRLQNNADEDAYSDIETMVTTTSRTAINAYWTSKITNYDTITNLKLVSKIFFTIKPAKRTSATLSVRSDLRSVWAEVKTIFQNLFTYSILKYSVFTYGGSDFPQQVRAKVKTKKIGYYQKRIQNNEVSESLGLLNVADKILYQREVK